MAHSFRTHKPPNSRRLEMRGRTSLLYGLLLWAGYCSADAGASQVTLTNLKCVSLNKHFAEVELCRLRAIKRGVRELSIRIKALQLPVDNISVHVQLLKKSNGYKPYMLSLTVDACKFMHGKMGNPLLDYLYKFLAPYTNLNHSCPFNHDAIVDRLRVDSKLLALAPIPTGEYALNCTWMTHNIERVLTQLYFSFEEK